MPLLQVNALGSQPVAAGGDSDLVARIAAHAARLAPGAPVTVMIHGFRFSPFSAPHSPHEHILSLDPAEPCARVPSWPRHLGFGRDPAAGLAVAFGWHARGTLWQAWAEAPRAGAALAALIGMLRRALPDRPVDIVAHSLGARVALAALPLLASGDVGRMVLMTAADLRARAAAAIDTPAGRAALVLNVTTRENDLFDAGLELAVAGGLRRGLGHGLPAPRANWIDLQLDHDRTPAALAALGIRLGAPARRICHWSAYLRPGIFALYRGILHDRDRFDAARLRAALTGNHAPRWSRLLPRPTLRAPFAGLGSPQA
ncbi:alpha/beta hydrolase [Frigidibacter oleivorans]|uniref:alpha/beta hydrolase n=1 Tax=Frigidibacter oleivorans TaxID=2487129 RepID=UPI000F8DEBDB|nr:alpha/beta hydrolase [Frigidibacter oleivorans]